jgi:K(+)-stimulated pyrophosphate-energized sodium pump
MNLISLLILPAVITLQDNDGARYAIAGAALVVLAGAIAFSKRSTGSIAGDSAAAAAAIDADAQGVRNGDRNAIMRQALENWIDDLGHEEHDLRDKLLAVKATLD